MNTQQKEAARIRRFLFVTKRLQAPDIDGRGKQFFHTVSDELTEQVKIIRRQMISIATDLDAGALTVNEAEKRLSAVNAPWTRSRTGHHIPIMWWPRWSRRVTAHELRAHQRCKRLARKPTIPTS